MNKDSLITSYVEHIVKAGNMFSPNLQFNIFVVFVSSVMTHVKPEAIAPKR